MKIFIDANVLVTVLCNEYPRYTACARVLSLSDNNRFEVYTSPLVLAIAAYFAEKKSGATMARKKIELVAQKLRITDITERMTRTVLSNKQILDIEDGLQYASAVAVGCQHIITYDQGDYHFATCGVLNAEDFLVRHAVPLIKGNG